MNNWEDFKNGIFDKDAIIGKLKTIKDAAVESTKKVTNEIKKNNEESKAAKHLLKVPSFDMQ